MKIDEHIKNMMLENTIAKEMFIACMLKCVGIKDITEKTIRDFTLIQQGITEGGVSKMIYRVEYTPRKRKGKKRLGGGNKPALTISSI